MTKANSQNKCKKCQICQKEFPLNELYPAELVRESIIDLIRLEHPEWSHHGFICLDDLRYFRSLHVKHLIEKDRGELSALDNMVIESLKEHELLSENINTKFDRQLTFGEKIADKVAKFGGSWGFILSFLGIIVVWMLINTYFSFRGAFDPYPFILLNLVLSCLAAIQAPIIMMSQNRQAEKDRFKLDDDYCVNLKSELEIRQLHAKFDVFMRKQWERILELQEIQIELAEDVLSSHMYKRPVNNNTNNHQNHTNIKDSKP